MTLLQASRKSNKKFLQIVSSNLKDKRDVGKPNYKLGDLVRTADIKQVSSMGDSTNYSYKLYTITEVIHDAIPSYRTNNLPERYI